jgi:SH3-like domain-containing protein
LEDERRNLEKAGAVVEELKVRIDELADAVSPLEIELSRLANIAAESLQPPRTLVLGPGSLLTLSAPVPLYIGPDVAHQPLMKTASNTEVEIVEVSESWWRVRVPDGVEGWVARDYLEVDQGRARVVAHLNVRLLPEVSERSVRFSEHLNPGDEVRVVDQQGDWVRVRLPIRFTAWMRTQDFAHSAGMSGDGVNQPGF